MRVGLASLLVGTLALACMEAPGGKPTVAAFARLKPGETPLAGVREALGRPLRDYDVVVEVGKTPVQVPYLDSMDRRFPGVDNPFTSPGDLHPRKEKAKADDGLELENLRVLQYRGPTSQLFYVVLKNDVVYYLIGPLSKREGTEEAVRKRYGKPDLVYVDVANYGDFSRSFEVYAYRKKRVALLRELGHAEFHARAVGLNLQR